MRKNQEKFRYEIYCAILYEIAGINTRRINDVKENTVEFSILCLEHLEA